MRVLVTGHNGYIGSILVPILKRAGHDVVGLDSDIFEPCVFGENGHHVPSLRVDVRDVASQDLAGFDAVIHLAAVCNDPVGNLNPQATYDINYFAAVRVAEKAKQAGVERFLRSFRIGQTRSLSWRSARRRRHRGDRAARKVLPMRSAC